MSVAFRIVQGRHEGVLPLRWWILEVAEPAHEIRAGFDPVHRGAEVGSQNILTDLYEGLVAFAADGGIVPGMAERWQVAADGRTWTFHLRTGLRWSNGEVLDAPQFVASVLRFFSQPVAA